MDHNPQAPGTAIPLKGAKPNGGSPKTGGSPGAYGTPTTITKVRCPYCDQKRIIEQEPECSCDPERIAAEAANMEQIKRNRARVLERDKGGNK